MLKAQKKLSKREIKEDKFVTFYFKTQEQIKQNSRQIISGVFAVAVLFLVFFLYTQNQIEKEENAIVELNKAQAEYSNGNYESAVPILQNLIEEYAGTGSAEEALFYLGNSYFFQKNFSEAERYYSEYFANGSDDILKSSALSGLAACFEERQDFLQAAQKYREAANEYGELFLAADQLYNAARCFLLIDKKEEARQALNLLLKRYETTNIKIDAELLLAEISS